MEDDELLARLDRLTKQAEIEQALLEARTKKFADGSRYVGEFKDACGEARIPHGFGEFYQPGGVFKYEGEWNNGLMHGKGRYMFENQDEWKGTFSKGQLHGYGVYIPFRDPKLMRKQQAAKARNRNKKETPEEKRAREQQENALKKHDVLYWKNKRVCRADQLTFGTRISIRSTPKKWSMGTILDHKHNEKLQQHLHLLRLDDDFDRPVWFELCRHEFRILQEQGSIFH